MCIPGCKVQTQILFSKKIVQNLQIKKKMQLDVDRGPPASV